MMAEYGTMMRFLLSVGILFQGCDADVKCRNDAGDVVDWYILYKLPKGNGDGLSYLYMDEGTKGWIRSIKTINSNTGTLANTLKPLFDYYARKTEGFGYMLYNDQPPTGNAPSSFGHSKGVVMLDRQTGVWLSHSTPKFPKDHRTLWPDSANNNAQTFMCVTYSYDTFNEIGLQLKYIHAYSFDSDIPTTFHNELRCVAQRSCYPKKAPWYHVMPLTSVAGKQFLSFAKYTRFGDDLYSGLIVNNLQQDLYVKSWGRMQRPLPSNCSTAINHPVYNVKEVQLLRRESISDTVDHSKWCVTTGGGWTCLADMNREVSQMSRGGGAICTNDAKVGRAFYAMIREHEACKHEAEFERREL
ncbi:plancitoxin-1-like [Sparus aurata]|uniref:Deoxyribonuclease-2-alpha n=1 Tax=Sparus aurata TaxID=8175 RepID=A0A671YRC5_SPAAU|nr:plancitoxin-1-like [Sparus aurata]